MSNTDIFKLFTAYIANEITEKQFKTLKEWMSQNPENEKQFSDFVLLYKRVRNIGFSETIDKNKAWDKVVSQLEQPLAQPVKKCKNKRRFWKYAVAASVLIIAGLTVFLKWDEFQPSPEPIIVNNQIQSGTDKATLTLEDGSVIELHEGTTYKTANANSNGEEIVYAADENNDKAMAYHYLTIPRGGQFFIKLSDGTRVWLNSESQLKYPVQFISGKVRQVELVYGEAYFDVSPSAINAGSKFKVLNTSQEVEVLGTEFNVKAYKDETNIYTTLVEGKVAVNTANSSKILMPHQQSNLNIQNKSMSIAKVNVYDEISWKKGVFSFRKKPLKEIMKVLSRWYDIDIIIQNKAIENEEFVGVLRKNQNLEKILMSIQHSGVVTSFEIGDKQVVLQ